MTGEERAREAGRTGAGATRRPSSGDVPRLPAGEAPPEGAAPPPPAPDREEPAPRDPEGDHDVDELHELVDAFGAHRAGPWSFVYAPRGNVNSGAVHGGQSVHNGGTAREGAGAGEQRVREGPVPEAEVRAASFGFARPDWYGEAFDALRKGPLFLAGRPGSGRRTVALNLLREACGEGAPLAALDSVTELDRWRPADPPARGYLMNGLFPRGPLEPGVLGHVRALLTEAGAHMIIMLPDDAELLRGLERDLHVKPLRCVPPSPARVFGAYFGELVPDQRERERLLSALEPDNDLGELLVPELVPSEVVELVTALVAADGDPDALGNLGDRLSYRAEEQVPALLGALREEPDALAFLLAAAVYEGLDHRLVAEEAARLLELSRGRLTAVLPRQDSPGAGDPGRPNPDFVFRRSLTDLLHKVHAVRQERAISTEGAYAHSVRRVVFVRHRQGEAVLRHVWREYGQVSELLVEWLRDVERGTELTRPVGTFMGRAASWAGGRRALRHIQALAASGRTTSRLIAANALAVAAEDPVLVAQVRYRLQLWSRAADTRLRTTVAYTCGTEFGRSRPDLALLLLGELLFGARSVPAGKEREDSRDSVPLAVRAAIVSLFRSGNEAKVFARLVAWLRTEDDAPERVLALFGQLLQSPRWFLWKLADMGPEAEDIAEFFHRALNSDHSFEVTCTELLRWAERARWGEADFCAVENLFAMLAHTMRFGELRLFVEIEEKGAAGWAGRETARAALGRWRAGERGEAA